MFQWDYNNSSKMYGQNTFAKEWRHYYWSLTRVESDTYVETKAEGRRGYRNKQQYNERNCAFAKVDIHTPTGLMFEGVGVLWLGELDSYP